MLKLAGLFLARRCHKGIKAFHRQPRLLPARHQPRHLHEGLDRPPRQNDSGNQRAGGDQPLRHQHRSQRHCADGHEIHHRRGQGTRKTRPLARDKARFGIARDDRFPVPPRPGLRIHRLDGVDPRHRLMQEGGFMRGLPVRLRNRCVNGPLQQQPGPHQHADGRKRHQHQPAADPEDDAEKQQHERHVPQRHQRRGGEEFPHRFKVAHAIGQRAGALRPRRPAHRQKMRAPTDTSKRRPAASTR